MRPTSSWPRAARSSIRTKILAIAWVPSLVLLVVGVVVASILARQSANQTRFTTAYAQAVETSSAFVAADQLERRLTVTYLLVPGNSRQALDAQRIQTDLALARLGPLLTAIRESGSDTFVSAITTGGASVGELPRLRAAVDSRVLTARQASDAYSQTFTVFHSAFESLATSAGTARIASEYQLTANLFRLSEWRSESETFEQAAYGTTGLTDGQLGTYLDRVGGYHSLMEMTIPRLPEAEQAGFAALTTSPAWQQLMRVENTALQRSGRQASTDRHRTGELPISQAAWTAASAEVSQKLIDQYLTHVNYSTGLAKDHARGLLYRSLIAGFGLLALSLLVFGLVTRMSNKLIRRLRTLRSETLDVAGTRLPAIVERLGQGEQVDLDTELPPLSHGTDEIGQVAAAFNEAQRTAVAAAAKEAETRSGTAKVFLNIAHRSQIVAHRQLKLLDQAERTQEDPDQLSLLFQLDHLTTRSRRNAENLIILGGGQAGRRWRNPVPLLDVVRSAVGEAETYTGIAIGQMPKASVSGAAVADVIHLLAELVDNATSFSPPTARVEVRGNVVGRGIVVEIEDQGLGIEPEQLDELNAMLQKPPDFGVMALSDEPRLGLFVVTQLAVRHGVRVTLTESPSYGGIRAVVLLPMELITSSTTALSGADSGPVPIREDLRETIPGRAEVIGNVLPSRRSNRMISLAPTPPDTDDRSPVEPVTAEPFTAEPGRARPVPVAVVRARPVPAGTVPARPVPAEAVPVRPVPAETVTARPVPAEALPARPVPAERFPSEWAPSERVPAERVPSERVPGEWPPPVGPPVGRTESDFGARSLPEPAAQPFSEQFRAPARNPEEGKRPTAEIPVIQTGPGTDRDARPMLPRRTRQAHIAPQLAEDTRAIVTAPQPAPSASQPSAENARDRMAAFQRGTRQGRQTSSSASAPDGQ